MRFRTALLLASVGIVAVLILTATLRHESRPAPRQPHFGVRQPRPMPRTSNREVRPVRPPDAAVDRSPEPASPRKIEWDFRPPPGIYPGPVEVSLTTPPADGVEVRYTTDGTTPRADSPRFEGPVSIGENTVIRTAGFSGGQRVTRVASGSYFLTDPPPLPIFSISLDPMDFQTVHLDAEARGRESERPAYLEILDRDGKRSAATGFGIRLHGGAGRQGQLAVKKAYRLYFRKQYGKGKLRAPLFAGSTVQEFDALILRSNYNDRFRAGRGDYNVRAAYLRDEVIRSIHRDMGAPAARGAWCLLYVNMEPRGLYNVVERPGDEFLASHLGGGDWDVIKTGDQVQSGSIDEWMALLGVVARASPGDENSYREIEKRVDLENFTGYLILNHWAQNHDWSYNNWYAARKRENGAKWIFLSWDAEWGLGLRPSGWEADSFLYHLAQRNSIHDLFAALLGHRKYRAFFLEQVKQHLAGALRPEKVLAHLEQNRAAIAPVMEEELRRFAGGYSLEYWRANIARAEMFARERGAVFLRQIESHLSEPFQLPPGIAEQGDYQIILPQGAVPPQMERLRIVPPGTRIRIEEER